MNILPKVKEDSPFYETNRHFLDTLTSIWSTALSNPYFHIKSSIKSDDLKNEIYVLESEIHKFNVFYNQTATSRIINNKLDTNLSIGMSDEIGIFYRKSTELNMLNRYLVKIHGGSLKYFSGQYEKIQNIKIQSSNIIKPYDNNKLIFSIEFKFNFEIQMYVSRLVVNSNGSEEYFSIEWYNNYLNTNKNTELTSGDVVLLMQEFDNQLYDFLPIVVYSWFNDVLSLGKPMNLWFDLALAEQMNSRRLISANIIYTDVKGPVDNNRTNSIDNQSHNEIVKTLTNGDIKNISVSKKMSVTGDGRVLETSELNFDNLANSLVISERIKQKIIDTLQVPDTSTARRSQTNKTSSEGTLMNLNKLQALEDARLHKATYLFKELYIYLKLITTSKLNLVGLDFIDLMTYFDVSYDNSISLEQTNPQLQANIKQLVAANIVNLAKQEELNKEIMTSKIEGVVDAIDDAQRGV